MKKPIIALAIYLLFLFFLLGCSSTTTITTVEISYADLVDKSILTHTGESVGDVINKIPQDRSLKSHVQQYLEPFSILCQDHLVSNNTTTMVNVTDHYPVGSEQPAWVSLFREGHFQAYYNTNIVRVFLKGEDPEDCFEKYHSVIRHPIRDIINSNHTAIDKIEIYAFTNDYASTTIQLNTAPLVYSVNEIDLSPKKKTVDLDSIEELFDIGIALKATEVDSDNNLFFWGKKDTSQTLAGQPISIADLAVAYRALFHYGHNSPYISLDTHEDNRYAKVNFGGHLQNTHIGHVVLEADKLFKTLSSGLDSNTHELITSEITIEVPGFLTENERSFLDDDYAAENLMIRYWFYPDNIGTVTDGSLAAVQTSQFFADAERQDIEVELGRATRDTIDHLNENYSQYKKAEKTYKELSNVGRLMALVSWLKENNMEDVVELDELLSVKIPAFTTPEKTKKMLSASTIIYSEDVDLSVQYVRENIKTFDLSFLLDEHPASVSDKRFLEIASNYIDTFDFAELYPVQYSTLNDEIDYYERLIDSNDSELDSLENRIAQKERTLDRYSSKEVEQYNNLVNAYNSLLERQKSLIDSYNDKINEWNKLMSLEITSITGGISLNPKSFQQPLLDRQAPKIVEMRNIKDQLKPAGNVVEFEDWVRSKSDESKARINKLPPIAQ